MGVSRTDYLMWGARVDPRAVSWDEHEAELDGAPGRRFDLIYDGMGGKYAVAGEIIAKSDQYDGIEFQKIGHDASAWRPDVVAAIRAAFPDTEDANGFCLWLFSHYH